MIAWTIYICFAGVLILSLLPIQNRSVIRWIALMTTLASMIVGIVATVSLRHASELFTVINQPWIASLGIHYFLAVDGISLVMVLLTGIASLVGILFSWNIDHRVKEFFCFYLALIGAVYGVFLSFDLFL